MKDKLHEKLIAMGDLEGKRFEDFTAACGEPKEVQRLHLLRHRRRPPRHLERRALHP